MSKAKRKPLKSASLMKQVMSDYYTGFKTAKKIAWCTSVGPAELLRSFGFEVFFPENHSAILGAGKIAADYIPIANAAGYSQEICSYLTADVGAFLKEFTPLTKLYGLNTVPVPDILVYNTNQCRDVQDWFSFYGRKFNAPVVGIHSPNMIGELKDHHVKNVEEEMQGLVKPLEEISRTKLDEENLRNTVRLSRDASILWRKVLETATHVPAPLTFLDGCIHMGPIVVLRGTEIAVKYYEHLLNELEERINEGVAAVEGERIRLYWEGMPVWGRLSFFAKLFLSLNVNAVASTYCNSWIFDELNPDKPFMSMARAYTQLFINRNEKEKEDYIKRMIKQFKIDGLVFHNARTCPANSNTSYGMPLRLKEELGIPVISFDGDLNDLRAFSDEHTKTKIEAFIESF
ncbi:MAG: 2-hydroxyacyl-CoA dehydratase subunit D [Candidatus Hodarchaeales archaeon]